MCSTIVLQLLSSNNHSRSGAMLKKNILCQDYRACAFVVATTCLFPHAFCCNQTRTIRNKKTTGIQIRHVRPLPTTRVRCVHHLSPPDLSSGFGYQVCVQAASFHRQCARLVCAVSPACQCFQGFAAAHVAVLTCWSRIAFRIHRREARAGGSCS